MSQTLIFKEHVVNINNWPIVMLPKAESLKLPSRGMVFVKGTVNKKSFDTILEPDGKGGHWFKTQEKIGNEVDAQFEISKDWPEPEVPSDLQKALSNHSEANALWQKITPMARHDWIHWIGSTANPETRAHRIDVSMSKLKKGMRRPCCFNRSSCLIPEVSKTGVLLEAH